MLYYIDGFGLNNKAVHKCYQGTQQKVCPCVAEGRSAHRYSAGLKSRFGIHSCPRVTRSDIEFPALGNKTQVFSNPNPLLDPHLNTITPRYFHCCFPYLQPRGQSCTSELLKTRRWSFSRWPPKLVHRGFLPEHDHKTNAWYFTALPHLAMQSEKHTSGTAVIRRPIKKAKGTRIKKL